jgi:ribonuclease G
VNLEAAREIGRQLRLRGIGGLVVVDFIHMRDASHAERVVAALTEHLAKDGVPVAISPMSQFGLVELTRKRVREPLASLVGETCGTCVGQGIVRRPDAVAMDILRRVEAGARAAPGKAIRVHAAPEVVAWLAGQGEMLRAALARRGAAQVSFVPDRNYSRERFDVGT